MRLHARSLQTCPTLCDPTDCSLPGFSVHGILQARILEWVAMPSSRAYSRPRKWPTLTSPALASRFFTIPLFLFLQLATYIHFPSLSGTTTDFASIFAPVNYPLYKSQGGFFAPLITYLGFQVPKESCMLWSFSTFNLIVTFVDMTLFWNYCQ